MGHVSRIWVLIPCIFYNNSGCKVNASHKYVPFKHSQKNETENYFRGMETIESNIIRNLFMQKETITAARRCGIPGKPGIPKINQTGIRCGASPTLSSLRGNEPRGHRGSVGTNDRLCRFPYRSNASCICLSANISSLPSK